MFLLPRWFPFHPGRMWCHARMVYLPMSWIYCKRWVYPHADADPLVKELREELYEEKWNDIQWGKYRTTVAEMDNYSPVNPIMVAAQYLLSKYESSTLISPLRNYLRSLAYPFVEEYLHAEDLQTNYVDIGPVNKVLNTLIAFAKNGCTPGPTFLRHAARVDDYLWVAEDGVKMQGYNGSQCWDTSFFLQAVCEGGMGEHFGTAVERGLNFLERTQILSTETSKVRTREERRTAGAKRQQYTTYSCNRQSIPRSLCSHLHPNPFLHRIASLISEHGRVEVREREVQGEVFQAR